VKSDCAFFVGWVIDGDVGGGEEEEV